MLLSLLLLCCWHCCCSSGLSVSAVSSFLLFYLCILDVWRQANVKGHFARSFKPLSLIHCRLETLSVGCLHGNGAMPARWSKIPMVSVQVSYSLIVLKLMFASGWPTRKVRENYYLLSCQHFPMAPPAVPHKCLTSPSDMQAGPPFLPVSLFQVLMACATIQGSPDLLKSFTF